MWPDDEEYEYEYEYEYEDEYEYEYDYEVRCAAKLPDFCRKLLPPGRASD